MIDEEPTVAEKKRIAERLKAGATAPSTEDRTLASQAQMRVAGSVGRPFSSRAIPLNQLYEMRTDSIIKFGLTFIKVPLMRSPWYIKCEDAQIAAFVDNALRMIYDKLIEQYTLSLDFGYQAIVKRFELATPDWVYYEPTDMEKTERKVWDNGTVKAIIWKDFVALRPESVEPIWKKSNGEFDGIKYTKLSQKGDRAAYPFREMKGDNTGVKVPLEHSLWVTNEKDENFGSLYGFPRLAYAYPAWWSYWIDYAWADRAFERNADPPTIVYHPTEKLDSNGNPVDAQEVALAIGADARSGSTIALPNDVISGSDGRDMMMRQWEIKQLEVSTNFDSLQERLRYLDVMKLRSIIVPEEAITNTGGSRNVAAEHGDIFQESQAVLLANFDNHLNKFVIPQLVAANFPTFTGKVEKVSRGFSQMDVDMARQLIQVIGQTNPADLGVDIQSVLDELNIPLLTPKQQKLEEMEAKAQQVDLERQMKEAAAAGTAAGTPGDPAAETAASANGAGPGQSGGSPPVTPSAPNQAGVTDFGLYYNPRESIKLSTRDFLPSTRQYEDDEVVEYTKEMYELWREELDEAYQDFAEYVRNIKTLQLSDNDGEKQGRVHRIVLGWRGFQEKLNTLQAKTEDLFRKIFYRAADRELEAIGLSSDDWSSSDPKVVEFLREHSSGLVKGIEDTTRNHLRNFLAINISEYETPEELGDAIAAHFSDFPVYRARTIARTEVMSAYNTATLLAGEQVGVEQVQAMDARKGPTDEDCMERDGKLFTIPQAFKEQEDEHPNGTLGFRLLPKGVTLSVEMTDETLKGDALAVYDSDEKSVKLSEDITDAQQSQFLLDVVDDFLDRRP